MSVPKLFERILVGVDADQRSNHAVHRAVALAQRLGSRVSLIHAVHVPPPLWPGVDRQALASMHAETLARAQDTLIESLAPIVQSAGSDWELADHLTVAPGHSAKVILDRALAIDADLVLLGPHAKRSLLDFGSTAKAVLAGSGCPVWTQTTAVTPVRRILVPVDFSENSLSALALARDLATRLEATLRIVHCYPPPEFAFAGAGEIQFGPAYVPEAERQAAQDELATLMGSFEWAGVSADSKFAEGRPDQETLREAEAADLIVMGTHGRTGLSRFLLGSVAQTVLRKAEIPVVTVPSHERTWLLGDSH